MKIGRETVAHVFKHHPPIEGQANRYVTIREGGKIFAEILIANCPESEERTLALRDIQRAVMMANASIAINES